MRGKLRQALLDEYKTRFPPKKFIPGRSLIPVSGKVFDEREIILATEAILDGWWTEGRFSDLFERKISSWLGSKFAVLVNSGSSANLLAISALKSVRLRDKRLKDGDEVITVAAGFPSTVNPIMQNNLKPVFVDIDLGTYNIKAEKVEKAVSQRTKAVMVAHTLGNPFNLDAVVDICQKNNLWLIEDNCDALGSKYNGKFTGTFGHISTSSFYPAHHITMGEGGALFTDDPLLNNIIRSLRDWGRDCWCKTGHDDTCGKRFDWQLGNLPKGYDHKYIYSEMGYNLKITDVQAALGLAQMEKLEGFIKKREENFNILYEGLKKYEKYFMLPYPTLKSSPSWFGFPLLVKETAPFGRTDIVGYLEKNKIATRMLFGGNLIKQPAYRNTKYRIYGNLKNTDLAMNNLFWIGTYPGLNKEKLEYVVNVIKKFIEK